MKKKLRYPEYINGIKQIQSPFKRFCVKIWYSDWFRAFFIIVPIWLVSLAILLFLKYPEYEVIIGAVVHVTYILLLTLGLCKNDYSELNRIGLDCYHNPLKHDIK